MLRDSPIGDTNGTSIEACLVPVSLAALLMDHRKLGFYI
jgi:hypothetical protein